MLARGARITSSSGSFIGTCASGDTALTAGTAASERETPGCARLGGVWIGINHINEVIIC